MVLDKDPKRNNVSDLAAGRRRHLKFHKSAEIFGPNTEDAQISSLVGSIKEARDRKAAAVAEEVASREKSALVLARKIVTEFDNFDKAERDLYLRHREFRYSEIHHPHNRADDNEPTLSDDLYIAAYHQAKDMKSDEEIRNNLETYRIEPSSFSTHLILAYAREYIRRVGPKYLQSDEL